MKDKVIVFTTTSVQRKRVAAGEIDEVFAEVTGRGLSILTPGEAYAVKHDLEIETFPDTNERKIVLKEGIQNES